MGRHFAASARTRALELRAARHDRPPAPRAPADAGALRSVFFIIQRLAAE
jgi:hypothetical protein